MSGEPFPKSKQLGRGTRRYVRKVASAKQWQAIQAAKLGPCRVCMQPNRNGGTDNGPQPIHFHHIVPRVLGGDDVADNIVPLCGLCHDKVTRRDAGTCIVFVIALSDAEYAYAVDKVGEDVWERVYGVSYDRS